MIDSDAETPTVKMTKIRAWLLLLFNRDKVSFTCSKFNTYDAS